MARAKIKRAAFSSASILFFAPSQTMKTVLSESYYQPLFWPLVAPLALHPAPNPHRSSLFGHHPLPHGPRRIVPYMLPMSALQHRCPMPLFILVKTHYLPLHRTPPP